MSFPRKITGALAWVGLAIVIAVPVIEMVGSKFVSNKRAEVTPVAEVKAPAVPAAKEALPAETAAVPKATVVIKPAVPAAPVASAKPVVVAPTPAPQVAEDAPATADAPSGSDAVKDYLAANKTLPSYITPSSPAKTADAAAAQPDSMTPAAQKLASTLSSEPSANQTAASTSPASSVAAASPDGSTDTSVATADTPIMTPAPVPMPVSARPKVAPAQTVTDADLKDWKSGTLEDYLRQHNLLAISSPDQGDGN